MTSSGSIPQLRYLAERQLFIYNMLNAECRRKNELGRLADVRLDVLTVV